MRHLSRITILVCLLIAPWPAAAVEVPVRTGEHGDFTRLVLDLPQAVTWRLEGLDGQRRLYLDGIEAEFDLSRSFRRIGRDRIADLSLAPKKGALDISLNCNCEVNAFLLNDRMLVIDIKDGTPSSEKPATPSRDEAIAPRPLTGIATVVPKTTAAIRNTFKFPFESEEPARVVTGFGPLALARGGTGRPSNLSGDPAPNHGDGTNPERGSDDHSHVTDVSTRPPQDKDDISETRRLSEAERRLAEQLGRAATQGLVDPVRGSSIPKPHHAAPFVTKAEEAESRLPEQDPELVRHPGINLHAATSADKAFLEFMNTVPLNRDGEPCLSDEDLAISNWGTEGEFAAEVGRLRRSLAQEFDHPDTAVAERLARLYIYFGFGAEARRTLEQNDLHGPTAGRLLAMADIMELGHARDPSLFDDQFECDSNAALWAILSHERFPPGVSPEIRAIARAINALHPRLRKILGPIASERLVEAGYDAAGAEVLAIVERGMEKSDTAYEMASAKLHLAEGDHAPADAALSTVVDSNTELSPIALVELIDTRLSQGEPVDSGLSDLAAAYAREYRRGDLGSELQRAHILALSATGAFDEAFTTMQDFNETAEPAVALRLRSHAMEALAADAGDVAFLKYATETAAPGRTEIDAAAGNAVGKRLLSLGFPDQANAYLVGKVNPPFDRPRALLRARIALASDRPKRAEAELIGIEGDDADLLRAEARSASGDHLAASRLFADLDQAEPAAQEAWLASDWDSLEKSNAPFWQDVANLIDPQPDGGGEPAPPAGPLARDRALLERSAENRRTMSSLLSRVALDPPSEEAQ